MYYIEEQDGVYTIVTYVTIRGPFKTAGDAQDAINATIAMNNHISAGQAVNDLFKKK
jgi:hypothetical protein